MGPGGATGAGSAEPAPQPGASGTAGASASPPPDLQESLRQVSAAGKSSLEATSDAAKAFRSLFFADVSLARSAFGRTMAFAGLAVACGGSAWLLLMATTIAVLRGTFGWGWATSMLTCAGLSIVMAGLAAWMASRYFEHTRLKATRRQLARLGLGELADLTPTPGSPQPAREATESLPGHDPGGHPLKDERGVPVTPP
jgi:hypothetical protein